LLRQETAKIRMELHRSSQEGPKQQCLCKYYEETLEKVKEDNAKFVEKVKATYMKELEDSRGRYEDIKLRVALDINEKTLHFIKERHGPYYESFKQEK